jgi:toxin CcdB
MPQFDVHRNIGKQREDIPYVVLVQSSLYDSYRRRVVVPLVRKTVLGKISNPRFNPSFRIEKNHVVLHPLEIVSIANEQLGEYVESLDNEGGRIMDALDELLTLMAARTTR